MAGFAVLACHLDVEGAYQTRRAEPLELCQRIHGICDAEVDSFAFLRGQRVDVVVEGAEEDDPKGGHQDCEKH